MLPDPPLQAGAQACIERRGESGAATSADGSVVAKRILVVEDAARVAAAVSTHLEKVAQEVTAISSCGQALELLHRQSFDLVVLDLALPGMDGLEVCRTLRAMGRLDAILMLSEKAQELDRIVALECGADDYLVRPFNMLELVARARAILRRLRQARLDERRSSAVPLRFEWLVIDPFSREACREGKRLALTGKEFDLLYLLARNPGRAYSRRQLLDLVWGFGGEIFEHTISSHVSHLRAKLELDPARPTLIETVWGVGYRFTPPRNR